MVNSLIKLQTILQLEEELDILLRLYRRSRTGDIKLEVERVKEELAELRGRM